MLNAVGFHENFVQMPSPVGVRSMLLHPPFPNLGCKQTNKSVPPEADGSVAYINASFMQKILHIAQ
jgi:hypothetical protein